MGAAILEALAREHDVQVRSAGTGAVEGALASAEAIEVAARHGLSLEGHRSSPLKPALVEWADHILVMEGRHKRVVERLGAGEKVTLLSEYGGDGRDITDPLGSGTETYEKVFASLSLYLARFLQTEERPKSRA